MSKSSDLVFRFLHRKLAASGDTPAQYAASGGTFSTAIAAALTEADDYWNGALCRWDSGPNTGLWSVVSAFDADTDTLTFSVLLPFTVAAGHAFTLFHGGKHLSDQSLPSLTASAPVNVTGVTLSAGALNAAGTGQLRFYYNGGGGAQTMTWQPPAGAEGDEVVVGTLAEGDTAQLPAGGTDEEDLSQSLRITRGAAALSTANAADDVLISIPDIARLPLVDAGAAARTIYRAVGVENVGAAPIYGIRAWAPAPGSGAATQLAAGLGTGADTLAADELARWDKSGWVYNATRDDLRYYYNRSGNRAAVLSVADMTRPAAGVAWDAGDDIEPAGWQDIGLNAPGAGGIFADPDEGDAPAGVSFSCAHSLSSALVIGDLAPGGIYCIWERWTIPAGARPAICVPGVHLYAPVTE